MVINAKEKNKVGKRGRVSGGRSLLNRQVGGCIKKYIRGLEVMEEGVLASCCCSDKLLQA